jgi:hypothetical protein
MRSPVWFVVAGLIAVAGFAGALLGTVFGTIAIAFAGLGIAGAIVFAVLWQRSRAAKPVATN